MRKLSLFLFFTFSSVLLFAQMSDDQVVKLLQNAQNQGMSQQEMVIMLGQKGVTQEQLNRIKDNFDRDGKVKPKEVLNDDRMRHKNTSQEQQQNDSRVLKEQKMNDVPVSIDSLGLELGIQERVHREKMKNEKMVFGRNIFNNKSLTFEPNLNIATPENYILGPGDEIIIDVWGDSEQTIRQTISPDGNIIVDRLGPIYLNGLTIKEAGVRLEKAFSQIFSAINGENPTTHIKVSLGQIRSILVNIMGEVKTPGTYTLPSLATLFHALYSAGGVNEIGSLRAIKVNRGGREIANIDIYEYLLNGKNNADINLKDGDVVVVSPYLNLIALTGKIKRPMIYEMKNSETIANLIGYSGGFTGDAYKKAVRVIRKNNREYQVFNIEENDFEKFLVTDGDAVSVDSVISRFENRVEVKGAVYRQGLYALENVNTLSQLIEKAEGIRGDAFLNRAVLYREKPDLTQEVEAVNLAGILNGSAEDILLRKNDILYIPSIFDLKEEYTIAVSGAVGYPGTYKYVDNMTLEDLVLQVGGLLESASTVKIDVARRIKDSKSMKMGETKAENFTFSLKDGLIVDGQKNFVLKPFDEIFFRESPGYHKQQIVKVDGEVFFAGDYVLSKKGERLSDLVKKAGGLTPDAYASGARLIRKINSSERARVQTMLRLSAQGGRDSIDVKRLDIGDYYYVGINLKKAMANEGGDEDIVLREGDQLTISEYTGTVKISGAVMYPNTVVYKKNLNLKYYIEQGGGFADRAKKRKVFIVHMNGTVTKSKVFSKARITPGSEIIVPVKPPRKGTSLAEIMSLASSTTSMAAMVTSILNMTK